MKAIRIGMTCGLVLCLASAHVLAQTNPAKTKRRHLTPASTSAASTLQQRQAEIARLRKQVATLETTEQQDSARLKQQQETMAELMAELRQQAQASPAAAAAVH